LTDKLEPSPVHVESWLRLWL